MKMAQMCTSRSKRKKYDGKGRVLGFMSMKNSSQGASIVDLPIFILTALEIFMQVSICR